MEGTTDSSLDFSLQTPFSRRRSCSPPPLSLSSSWRPNPALPRPRHLFMLATPNHSPRLARRFQHNLAYRLITGDVGQLLADPDRMANVPVPEVPYTVVVGTSGGRGRWSVFGEEPNDWIVSLSEARLTQSDELVALPVGHTFLMNYREVATLIAQRVGVGSER